MSTADFFNLLFEPDDLIELRPIRHDGGGSNGRDWLDRSKLANLNGKLEQINATASVYFGVNPRNGRGGKREDVELCRCLFADFDGGVTVDDVWATIEAAGLPRPSATVNSGGGVHVYWRLADPITPDEFELWQPRLIQLLGSDTKPKDAPRVMRLPGTINRKYDHAPRCEVVEITGEVFDAEDIVMRLPDSSLQTVISDDATPAPLTHTTPTDAAGRAAAYVESMPPAISGERGHDRLMAAVRCVYDGFDLPRTAAKIIITQNFNPTCTPPWSDREIEHKLDEVEKVPGKHPRGWLLNASRPDGPPAGGKPRCVSLGGLRRSHPELRPVLVDGLLRRGEVGNLVAASKVGKSWLAYDLAASVITGTNWLGTFACKTGRVLLIDNELHPETIAHRVPKVAHAHHMDIAELDAGLDVLSLRGRGVVLDEKSSGPIIAAIESGVYSLIIADAWYRFIPPGINENDNAGVMGLYNLLDRYAATTDAAWLVVHHASKGQQGEKAVTDVGAGAGAQSRAADAHVVLRPHEEDDAVVLEAKVRSFAPVKPVGLRWDFPLWRRADDLDPDSIKGKLTRSEERQAERTIKGMEAIQAKLSGSEGMTPKQIREATGFRKSRTDGLLEQMVANGMLSFEPCKIRGQTTRRYRNAKN
ncbi:MAG: AAA family ATPase [Planctomycetota bacterium]